MYQFIELEVFLGEVAVCEDTNGGKALVPQCGVVPVPVSSQALIGYKLTFQWGNNGISGIH